MLREVTRARNLKRLLATIQQSQRGVASAATVRDEVFWCVGASLPVCSRSPAPFCDRRQTFPTHLPVATTCSFLVRPWACGLGGVG